MRENINDIDPEELGEEVSTAVAEILPAKNVAIAEILPDFDLMTALQFVPDVRLKKEAERLAAELLAVEIANKGEDGLRLADAKIAPVRKIISTIELRFQGTKENPGPTAVLYALHRRLTGLLADFTDGAKKAVEAKNKEMGIERKRLDAEAERERVRRQEEADAEVRANAKNQLEIAVATGAAKETIKALKQQAKAGAAPPVAAPPPPKLANSTIVTTKKVRFKGTPPTGEPHPEMKDLPKDQIERARRFFKAVGEGWIPLAAVSINWSYLDKLANNDGTTFDYPELEVFEDTSARSKGRK